MFKMQLVRNAVGSGLISVMAAMSALGGASYLVSELMMGSEKVIKRDASVEAYKQLVDLVRKNLYSGNNCSAALGNTSAKQGISITNALGGSASPGEEVSLTLNVGDANVVLGSDFRSKTGTSIKNIKLKIDQLARPVVRLLDDPVPKFAAYATLYIEPDHKGINIYKKDENGKYIYDNLFIKLFVYYEAEIGQPPKLVSCYEPTSDAAFCTLALGGSYNPDPSVPVDMRCQPDLQCFSYKGGVTKAAPGAENMGCPTDKDKDGNYLYTGTKVGDSFTKSGSTVTKDGGSLVMCNWCNPKPAPVGSFLGLNFLSTNENDMDIENEDGKAIECGKTGYTGLDPEQSYEGYTEEVAPALNLVSADMASHYSECLSYKPEQPVSAIAGSSELATLQIIANYLNSVSLKKRILATTNGFTMQVNGVKTKFSAEQALLALNTNFDTGSFGTKPAVTTTTTTTTTEATSVVDMSEATIAGISPLVAGWDQPTRDFMSANGYEANVPELSIYISYTPQQIQAAIAYYDKTIAAQIAAAAAASTTTTTDTTSQDTFSSDPQCFIAGTQVTLKNGLTKKIEDMKVGDEVLTYDELRKSLNSSPVINVIHHDSRLNSLFTFSFSDGKEVTSNDIHPFYVVEINGYLKAHEIYQRWIFNQQTSVLTEDGKIVGVHHIGLEKKNVKLYNIHVRSPYDTKVKEGDFNHNYFANGILVHNRKATQETIMDNTSTF